MAKLHALTEDQVTAIRDVVRQYNRERVNTPSRPSGERAFAEAQDWLPPETYVARIPDSGIPALIDYAGGASDIPGSASCRIYKILTAPIGTPYLAPTSFYRTVYNLSESDIRTKYAIVTRDKFGKWLIDCKNCVLTGTGSDPPPPPTGTGSTGTGTTGTGSTGTGSTGTGSTGTGSTGTGTGTTGTGTGTTGTGDCPTIPGINFDDLASESAPDFILGIKDGCLVKVPVSSC